MITSTVIPKLARTGGRRHITRGGVSRSRWPVAILGVAFDPVTMDETLGRIARMVESGRSHYIVTPNVDFLVRARHDAELRRILIEAPLVLCDGTPLVWASRWLGNPLPERVAGADLAPRLLEQAERAGYRIFLLGATPETNAEAVARLRERHPKLVVAGHYSPPFRPLEEMDDDEIIRRVRSSRPDIVFVSFGCPKQEKWIARHYRELGVPVCLGVGAVIDFIAGRVRRAPPWMRPLGLEWFFRLCQEPRRLFLRYAEDMRYFGPAILAQCWIMRRWRKRQHEPASSVRVARRGSSCLCVRISGRLDRETIQAAARIWRRIGAGRHDCVFDLAEVDFIDSTGAALLLKRRKQLKEVGRRLALRAPSKVVRAALNRMGVMDFFDFEIGRSTSAGGLPEWRSKPV